MVAYYNRDFGGIAVQCRFIHLQTLVVVRNWLQTFLVALGGGGRGEGGGEGVEGVGRGGVRAWRGGGWR